MNDLLNHVRVWLDGQDGYLLAAGVVFAFVAVCVLCSLYAALAKIDVPKPTVTRPASSNRKAGRATVTGGAR